MKLQKLQIPMIALLVSLAATSHPSAAQTVKVYQQMSASEQTIFTAEQARQIALRMSGTNYQFTPSFETEIQKVDMCSARQQRDRWEKPIHA